MSRAARVVRIKPAGGAMLRLAALSFAVAKPDVQKELYLIPRGETPRAKASSQVRRREMADPEKRKDVLARLAQGRDTEAYREKRRRIPRHRGRWVKARKRRVATTRDLSRIAAASRARFQDPEFRARVLAQLAKAREKRKGSPKVAAAARLNARKPRRQQEVAS